MSIDLLQEKIRKLKNPSMVDLTLNVSALPPQLRTGNGAQDYARFCKELLTALKGLVPAIRVSFSAFALLSGMTELSEVLRCAEDLGYYSVMDAPYILSPMMASMAADIIFGEDTVYPCDGLIIPSYPGTDCIRPFLPYVKNQKKDLFVVVRTSNKSAPELQDLMTGTRLVHMAAADLVNRFGEENRGRCAYSRVSVLAGANSAGSLNALRTKYPELFLLMDDMDYTGCNAKICSAGFDRFGHGAAVCAGPLITMAWEQAGSDGRDYREQATAAAERRKKNLTRYVTVL